MSAVNPRPFQIDATPDFQAMLEREAAKLNMTVSAYIYYLHSRLRYGKDTPRFDQVVKDVFGKYGQVMRNLAK